MTPALDLTTMAGVLTTLGQIAPEYHWRIDTAGHLRGQRDGEWRWYCPLEAVQRSTGQEVLLHFDDVSAVVVAADMACPERTEHQALRRQLLTATGYRQEIP